MKSAYQIMMAASLANIPDLTSGHTHKYKPSKPNGTKLAAKKHRRRTTNASKRRNRKR